MFIQTLSTVDVFANKQSQYLQRNGSKVGQEDLCSSLSYDWQINMEVICVRLAYIY